MLRLLIVLILMTNVSCYLSINSKNLNSVEESTPVAVSPPSLLINNLAPNDYINGSNNSPVFMVSGTCNQAGKPVVLSIDGIAVGTTATCDGNSFMGSISTLLLSEGSHQVVAELLGEQNNVLTLNSVTLVKDCIAPVVLISSPSSGTEINTNNTSISGTCSENGKPVILTATRGASPYLEQNTTCSGGSFTSNFNFSSLGYDEQVSVRARQVDAAGNEGLSGTISLTQKMVGEPSIYIQSVGTTQVNSASVNLILLASNFYQEMYITNTAGCGSNGSWETYSPSKANWILNPGANGVGSVYVKFRTSLGVESSCLSRSVLVVVSQETDNMCIQSSSNVSMGTLYDSGGAAADYQNNENCNFTINNTGPIKLHYEALAIEDGYEELIIRQDNSSGTILQSLTGNQLPQDLIVNNGPLYVSFTSDSSVTESGFKLIWSPVPAVVPPVFAIDGGANNTLSTNVSLSITTSDPNLQEMYITNSSDCSSGGVWEATVPTRSWTLPGVTGDKTVYIKFRDGDHHETTCDSDSIYYFDGILRAVLSGTPTSADTSLGVQVGGSNVTQYRYKLGVASVTDCADSNGYSAAKTIDNSILADVSYFPNGNLKLCVVGGDINDLFQSFTDATVFQWSKASPVGIEFAESGRRFIEGNQTIDFHVVATSTYTSDIIVKYDIFGDLVDEQGLVGGQVTIPAGSTQATISVALSNNSSADVDKALTVGIASVTAPHKAGYQRLSTVLITDAQRTPSLTGNLVDIDNDGTCAVFSSGVLKCAGHIGGYGAGSDIHVEGFTAIAHPTGGIFTKIVYTTGGGGHAHRCALDTENKLYCWGWGFDGNLGNGSTSDKSTPTLVAGGHIWKQVSATTWNVICGIDSQDDLYCWGDQTYSDGAVGNGSTSDATSPTLIDSGVKYSFISTTGYVTCAITMDGDLKCWGSASMNGQATNVAINAPAIVDAGTKYQLVKFDGTTACGLTAAGAIKCWSRTGINFWTGSGSIVSPTIVDDTNAYQNVEIVGSLVCGHLVSGEIRCLGTDFNHLYGTSNYISTPLAIDPGVQYQKLTSSSYGFCGLHGDGSLKCWNSNWASLWRSPYSTNFIYPTLVGTDKFVQFKGNCGITTTGYAKCVNAMQIGTPYDSTRTSFKPYGSSVKWKELTGNNCGIDFNGYFRCWSYKDKVSLSRNDSYTAPVIQFPDVTFKKISHYDGFYCGIRQDDSLACWGSDNYGRRGDGASIYLEIVTPMTVDNGFTYRDVNVAKNYVCGITTANKLKCWGSNKYSSTVYGNLGTGDTLDHFIPTEVDAGEAYSTVKGGNAYSACALTVAGQIKCWGRPMGNAAGTALLSPIVVSGGDTYTYLDSNGDSACGVRNDGRVLCWGLSNNYSLGTGNNSNQISPVLINDTDTYKSVFVPKIGFSSYGACGVTTANQVKCWGYVTWPMLYNPTLMTTSGAEYVRMTASGLEKWIGIKADGGIEWQGNHYDVPGKPSKSKFLEFIQGLVDR